MKVWEKLLAGLIIGFIFPIFFFLLIWWASIPFVTDGAIFRNATGGLIIGILINFIWLKFWIEDFYQFRPLTLVIIYLFYMVGLFGFFMGVPVFNCLPGIIAGMYVARRSRFEKLTHKEFHLKLERTQLITLTTTAFFCMVSALLALTDPYTSANLQSMLALPFTLSFEFLLLVIFVGGTGLLLFQYMLTELLARFFYK